MKVVSKLFSLAVIGVAATSLSVQGHAYTDHPAYIHALEDLRYARGFLDRLTPSDRVDDREQHAIDEIDAAIREIKKASIEDGKDLRDHPPIDAHLKRTDRFHKAEELLDKAHSDVKRDEDNRWAEGLQDRALRHIDEAHHIVGNIIHDWHNE